MDRLKNGLVGVLLLAIGAFGGYVIRGNPVQGAPEPDAYIKTGAFEASLTLSDTTLVNGYGTRDIGRLFESTMYGIYGEIEAPKLKEVFRMLRIKYLNEKMYVLKMLPHETPDLGETKIVPENNNESF